MAADRRSPPGPCCPSRVAVPSVHQSLPEMDFERGRGRGEKHTRDRGQGCGYGQGQGTGVREGTGEWGGAMGRTGGTGRTRVGRGGGGGGLPCLTPCPRVCVCPPQGSGRRRGMGTSLGCCSCWSGAGSPASPTWRGTRPWYGGGYRAGGHGGTVTPPCPHPCFCSPPPALRQPQRAPGGLPAAAAAGRPLRRPHARGCDPAAPRQLLRPPRRRPALAGPRRRPSCHRRGRPYQSAQGGWRGGDDVPRSPSGCATGDTDVSPAGS